MKYWKWIKLGLYTVLAVLVLIFRESLLEYPWFLIGGLMLMYSLEACLVTGLTKKHFLEKIEFYWALIEFIIGITLVITIRESITVFVTWAIWSLFRESLELKEQVELWHEKVPTPIDTLESLVAIVLSIMLLMEPGHHHAMTHMYLLFFELILTALLPIVHEWIIKRRLIKNNQNNKA